MAGRFWLGQGVHEDGLEVAMSHGWRDETRTSMRAQWTQVQRLANDMTMRRAMTADSQHLSREEEDRGQH